MFTFAKGPLTGITIARCQSDAGKYLPTYPARYDVLILPNFSIIVARAIEKTHVAIRKAAHQIINPKYKITI